ncbi:MAG: hypothetical protein KGI57_10865 [Hyphomicrobiales bacterium]|nr:hypothetical protein [Hyphomicrobiales bacterium]
MRLPRTPQAFAALFSLGVEPAPPTGPSFERGTFKRPRTRRAALRELLRPLDGEPTAGVA